MEQGSSSGCHRPRDREIDRLVDSNVTSIRYAVITQLLGKVALPDRSLMYLQSGTDEPGAWNARSFCDSVVVPWVSENQYVLGTSAEPYASKPLRRLRLEHDMPDVRSKAEWSALFDFFDPLDKATPVEVQKALKRCLESVARALVQAVVQVPSSSPSEPARFTGGVGDLLIGEKRRASPSGSRRCIDAGLRARVLDLRLHHFARHQRGRCSFEVPPAMLCYDDDDNMILAIEVKDRELTLSDVKTFTRKARESDKKLSNLLFAAPRVREQEVFANQSVILQQPHGQRVKMTSTSLMSSISPWPRLCC